MTNKFILLFLTLLSASCATSLEHIRAPSLGNEWKIGYQHRERFTDNNITEYVPRNESIRNWSKLYTVQYSKNTNVVPKSFAKALLQRIQLSCPEMKSKLINNDNISVMYEWSAPACNNPNAPKNSQNINTAQHEIFRIIKGNEGFFKLSYVEKTKKMNSETRAKWINKLNKSQIYKDGKMVKAL